MTLNVIKAESGDSVKSKNYTVQANELLRKLITYDITVLINAMYELGIETDLGLKPSVKVD